MFDTRHLIASAARGTLRATLAVAIVATSLTIAPAPAAASRLATDRVGGIPLSSSRVATSTAPDITARSGRLVASDGRVLWTRKSRTERPMASTTKIMTALLVLENCSLDDKVTITRSAARTPYALGLRAGEKRTVRTLLELSLVASSNDAATALAIHTAGSTRRFVRMMNKRAAALRLEETRFANVHGLDAKGHHSSAKDLVTLMTAANSQAEFRRIVKKRSVVLPKYGSRPKRTLKSTNELLGVFDGMRGGKTGYTRGARYCLSSTARRDGVTLTSVLLGSPTSGSRFTSSKRLLAWGFKNYRLKQLCSAETTAGHVAVSDTGAASVRARCETATVVPVFRPRGAVNTQAELQQRVAVPVFAGQRLGVVRFVQDSMVIATVPAVAAHSVASAEEIVGEVPVIGSAVQRVVARAAPSTAEVAAFDSSRPVERRVELVSGVVVPVAAGHVLGTIVYVQDGRELVRVPAVAGELITALP